MKSFNKLFVTVLVFLAFLIFASNLLILRTNPMPTGRPYRVEISRICGQIEEKGFENIDLSGMKYVTDVVSFASDPEGFYTAESDCLIRQVGGELYRFDYTAGQSEYRDYLIPVNLTFGIMALVVIGALLYVRQKILAPFEMLTDVPYELSKGNLTVPIREHKSRFFGKFVWGVDLLRENMEQQK